MEVADCTSGCDRLALLMQALASPVRLRILGMLARKPSCVKVIAADLAMSQPAVSQHLRVLRQAGLVVTHKSGYYVHYRLDRQALRSCQACLAELTEEPGTGSAATAPPAWGVRAMTGKNVKCLKPENLKGRPQDCSAEQISKCHGTGKAHPCVPKVVPRRSDT